jgi:hypothetical protein
MQGGCALLTKNHRQEALSRAYIQAIAARAGMTCSSRGLDYGIDLTVHEISRRGRRIGETGFRIDFQAKSTDAAGVTPESVLYDLDVKNYDDLRVTPPAGPRLLVVLVLPGDETQWTEQNEEQLLLRRAAYWVSLMGRPPVANVRTVRLALPRANLFTIEALREMMDRLHKGEPL